MKFSCPQKCLLKSLLNVFPTMILLFYNESQFRSRGEYTQIIFRLDLSQKAKEVILKLSSKASCYTKGLFTLLPAYHSLNRFWYMKWAQVCEELTEHLGILQVCLHVVHSVYWRIKCAVLKLMHPVLKLNHILNNYLGCWQKILCQVVVFWHL